ncbi:caspase family protein [Bacteroides acidifaciens]|uniref:caspase family protein n=1 Tax=Bacteroides acidifaciens TaxID=85831 RepID=UPI003F5CFA4E
MAILTFTPQEVSAKVLLVAVGIGDYPKPINPLNLPTKDAIAIKTLIDKNGDAGTAILLDKEATKSAILSEIHARFDHASTDDIIIFFFSGHGYKGGFVAYDGELPYSLIREAMGSSKCKNKMIFADACFSGKMRQGKRQVKEENSDSNVMLFLSSRDNETSIERRDMTNGFFTICLKDGLSGKADENRDRKITAKEIFNYVSKNVKKLSRDKQHPVMWGNFSNDMPVIIW